MLLPRVLSSVILYLGICAGVPVDTVCVLGSLCTVIAKIPSRTSRELIPLMGWQCSIFWADSGSLQYGKVLLGVSLLNCGWSSCFNIPLTLFLLCSQVVVLPYPILCGPGGEGRSITPEVGTCHLIKLHSKLNSSLLLFINASQKGSNYQIAHRCSQLVKEVMCFGKDVLMDTEGWV